MAIQNTSNKWCGLPSSGLQPCEHSYLLSDILQLPLYHAVVVCGVCGLYCLEARSLASERKTKRFSHVLSSFGRGIPNHVDPLFGHAGDSGAIVQSLDLLGGWILGTYARSCLWCCKSLEARAMEDICAILPMAVLL